MPHCLGPCLSAALLTVTACDARLDSDHHGQALATLSGQLRSARATPVPDPQVSLAWIRYDQAHERVGAERGDAQGLFPRFTLSVYQPPHW